MLGVNETHKQRKLILSYENDGKINKIHNKYPRLKQQEH